MVHGEMSPGTAHAAHDFVGDQEDVVVFADFSDFFQISARRYDSAQGCSADRLKNHGGNSVVGIGDCLLDLSGVLLAAIEAAIGAVIGAAITIRGAHGGKLAHHRTIDFPPPFVARNGHCAESGAVIALVATDDLRPLVFVRLALRTYRSLLDCRSKLLARPGNLIGGNDCWGSYENVVAPVAVRAALHRIDEQTALGRRLGDSSAKIDFNCKRSFRGLIGHKLDRPEKANSPYIAD